MNTLLNLARQEIISLIPYSSARNESSQARIHLDANENPFTLSHEFNRYPEPQPLALQQRLCSLYEVTEEQLLVTRGSDEAIDLLVRVFCKPNQDGILITPPTYGMYSVSATIQGAFIKSVPLLQTQGFALDIDSIIQQWQPNIKLIFLCSPNNPTGNTLDQKSILELCTYCRDKALVIIDEAYIEFASSGSFAKSLNSLPNLVILRTTSKAYGLAGARCGSVLAQPELIALLKKVIAPYPIPSPVAQIVLEALSINKLACIQQQIQIIQEQRNLMRTFLLTLSSVRCVYPSQANFLLVQVDSPIRWLNLCREQGIIIRDRSNNQGLVNCVRLTIGTPEENQKVREVLTYV